MKYLIISVDSNDKIYLKEFKTYEKAKPYFEEQRNKPNVIKVYLTDAQEEFKGVEI